jgi:hypothetical protein
VAVASARPASQDDLSWASLCPGARHRRRRPHAVQYLGEVQRTAKSKNVAESNANARNDLRNKAAAMGATVVVLDTNTAANAMDWTGRTQVVLGGRAFRANAPSP